MVGDMRKDGLVTCSSPRCPLCSHSLVCIENHLFIVGIGPILNKELELIFRSDRSDRTCVYSRVSVLHDKLYLYQRNEKCIVFWILKCYAYKLITVDDV